jgi:hypothetical protein
MPTAENPQIIERPETPGIPTELQQNGVQPTTTTPQFNVQVQNNQPIVSNQSAPSAKITLPSDKTSLLAKAKGSVTDAITWLAKLMLRMIAQKEIHQGANTGDNL